MVKRLLLILLCICMLLPMAVSCKKESEDKTGPVGTVSSLDDDSIPDNVGDARFDGVDITFAVRDAEDYIAEFFSDTTDSKIDGAVFKREVAIEERLGINLEYIKYTMGTSNEAFNTSIRNGIISGSAEFSIVANYAYFSTPITIEGLYANICTMPYITLSNPWYSQSFVEEVTYKDRLYLLTGEMCMSSTEYIVGMFYNNDLAAAKGINQNLYGVVADGDWTLEYFKRLIANVYEDVDGRGTQDPDDVYGLIIGGGAPPIDQLLYATGFRFTERNSAGEIEVNIKSASNVASFAAIHDLFHKTPGVGFFPEYLHLVDLIDYFKDSGGIFMITQLKSARKDFTDLEFSYGLLPLPKLDENQTEYYSFTGDAYSNISVVHNAANKEAIGAVIEVMSRMSYYDLRPVVFEEVYKYRYFDQPEMAAVFDTIVDSRVFEFGAIYTNALDNPIFTMRKAMNQTSNMFSSTAQSENTKMKTNLPKVLDALAKGPI